MQTAPSSNRRLFMSENEIYRACRHAKDPGHMIGILAAMNSTDKQSIREIIAKVEGRRKRCTILLYGLKI